MEHEPACTRLRGINLELAKKVTEDNPMYAELQMRDGRGGGRWEGICLCFSHGCLCRK